MPYHGEVECHVFMYDHIVHVIYCFLQIHTVACTSSLTHCSVWAYQSVCCSFFATNCLCTHFSPVCCIFIIHFLFVTRTFTDIITGALSFTFNCISPNEKTFRNGLFPLTFTWYSKCGVASRTPILLV